MTLKAIEANELKALPWNEIQKMHRTLKLRQGPDGGKRADYERRILTYFTRRDELLNQEPTGVTCATCQFAKHLDGDRYCCGLTDAVTRGHWEAKTDCLEAIAEVGTETETETVIAPVVTKAETEAPIVPEEIPNATELQPETTIAQTKRAMPFFFNLPLPEYVAFSEKQSVPFLNCGISHREIFSEEVWLTPITGEKNALPGSQLLTPRAPWGWKFCQHSSGERNLSYWIKEWESDVKFQNLPADIIAQYKFTVAEIQFLESASDSVLDLGDNELSYDRYLESQNIREYVGTHS
ncbi:MAG: hypothetical protein EAZ18_00295 [Oscillatoriales cyanobacterium]|nr:MAG: hypothetical protein EAZ18_00295 [Oscillatoriales cyanobacterium]